MAFGDYATLLDDFNRADANPIGLPFGNLNLNNSTQLRILSNQVTANGSLTGEASRAFSGDDLEAYLTIATLPGTNNSVRIYVRVHDTGGFSTWDGYGVRYQQNATPFFTVERWTNAALSTIQSQNLTLSAGDKIGIRVVGSAIEGWVYQSGAWTMQVSGTDTTYPTSGGFIAFGVRGTTGRVDDFYAGLIPPAWKPRTITI